MINPDFKLKNIPERTVKPRQAGITMVMDKGLSCREVEDFLEVSADKTDIVKLGFGTSTVTPNLERKIKIYQDANIPLYFGGTLFEAYVIRGQFDDYRKLLDRYNVTHVEVSDGSIEISEEEKCGYIRSLAKDFTVLSEVGSKDAEKIIPPYKWIAMMKAEIEAGAWKVIAEARESGTVGIFRNSGEVRSGLIEEILQHIPLDTILWEAPQKSQQVWFMTLYGHNINLGNIAPNEVIPLETLRLGLRGDTFNQWL
ncbi:MAG: phosphosulfolactate synthase [Bacteroidia bacterium]|jgi:phosphosulfolactate synthase|tara:strand:+ start:2769 stop:3533 length:765 start_codon:yes stop_codon:yes gene_type:complete